MAHQAAQTAAPPEATRPTPTPTSAPVQRLPVVQATATAFHHPQYLKIFPPSTTKNCTPQRRPQRPRLRPSVLPSRLRSPAFFLLRNWWDTRACKSPRPVRGPGLPADPWTPRRSFVRPRRPLPRPRPSVFRATALVRPGVNALPRRRIPKTIRF